MLSRGIRDHIVESTDSSMVKRDDGCSVEESNLQRAGVLWPYFAWKYTHRYFTMGAPRVFGTDISGRRAPLKVRSAAVHKEMMRLCTGRSRLNADLYGQEKSVPQKW